MDSGGAAAADPHGRDATNPWQMPFTAWKQILWRAWNESGDDNIGLAAAGVAFYIFLAIVPLLASVVLSYGLIAEPATVMQNIQSLTQMMPQEAAKLIGEQLISVVQTSTGKKGLGLLIALGIALFGARNAAGAIVTALNMVYEEKERRNFFVVNLLAIGITTAGVVFAILAVIAVAALAALEDLIPWAPGVVVVVGKVLTYTLLALGGAAAAAALYRYGPSRADARWVWLSPGSVFTAILWLGLTFGFGIYVANFGNYNATYGSLSAVVVLLTFLYLSSYILLFGGEINSELEHQTARDTTTGHPRPLGARGAWVADHVAGQDAAPPPQSGLSDKPAKRQTLAPLPAPSRPPLVHDLAAARAGAGVARLAGYRRVGMISSGIATIGLALIRRPGRARQGVAMIGLATGIAWLRRERT